MQCIGVFARLDLADMLADGPKDVDWLARKAGAHAPSLLRLLRALVRLEIVNQVDERTFALAPLGEPLRRDHPRSLARLAAQRTDPWWQAWGVLYHSIKTGGTAFEHAYGAPFFSTLSSDPEAAARFDDYMSELAVPLATSVAQVIDLAGTAHLVDVGGGRGTFAIELARRWPALRATVFDLPGVAQRARTEIEAVGLSKRCDTVGGDFFAEIPPAADAYLLSHVIHNWGDDEAVKILSRIHDAMAPGAKAYVVESPIPAGAQPFKAALRDVAMLVLLGSRERTIAEYRALLGAAGLTLREDVVTDAAAGEHILIATTP